MIRNVEVEVLDKSCETCPMFEIGAEKLFVAPVEGPGRSYYAYTCDHQDFCQAVLTNWEKHHKEETA